jgi:hypothetical protein
MAMPTRHRAAGDRVRGSVPIGKGAEKFRPNGTNAAVFRLIVHED